MAGTGGKLGAVGLALCACAGWAACGPPSGPATPLSPGVLTLSVMPAPIAVDGLQITSGRIDLPGITVYGDVAPDARATLPELRLDLLQAPGPSFVFDMLPQGLYSRVRFLVEILFIEGTFRGMPLHVRVALGDDDDTGGGEMVDLRSPMGQELLPGRDAAFAVDIDTNSWFAGAVLDAATPLAGEITINSYVNRSVANQIGARLAGSFSLEDTSATR